VTYPGSGGRRPPEQPPYQRYGYGNQPTAAYPTGFPAQGFPAPPRRRGRRGLVVGIVIAIVVVAGGTAATVWALNRSTRAGSATPQAAVAKLAADVSAGDLLGVQSDLAPAEAAAIKDIVVDGSSQLKRLEIENPSYNPVSTVINSTSDLGASGLRFDDANAQTINDHLVINKLVGGRIRLSPKLDQNMFTQQFLRSAFPNGLPKTPTNTIDIADVIRRTGQPVRIATVKVDGGWYTSVFYTAADYALQSARLTWPATSLPAIGQYTADNAVRAFAQSLLNADYRGAIEATDPNEMAVLHDAGPALLNRLHRPTPTGITIDTITFTDRPVAGGVDAVLRTATLRKGGDTLSIQARNGCYAIADQNTGDQRSLCPGDFADQMRSDLTGLPPDVTTALQHLTSGVLNSGLGLVATETGGRWYVSPARSVGELLVAMVSGLQPDDIKALLGENH
jgi:hypothetical protein